MTTEEKIVKLMCKAEAATTHKKARKILKKFAKLQATHTNKEGLTDYTNV